MQNFSTGLETKKENYFLSQPHQPFFLAGIVWAIVVMLIYMLSYKMMLKGSIVGFLAPVTFHAYTLIYIVFTQFFIGFYIPLFRAFVRPLPLKNLTIYVPFFCIK